MKDSEGSPRQRLELWERELGQQIRAERQRLGVSQAELAARMHAQGFGMIQTTIAKIEAGSRPLRISEFAGIAHALGMTWHSLLAVSDSMLEKGHPIEDLEERLNGLVALEDQMLDSVAAEMTEFSERLKERVFAYASVRAARESMAALKRLESEERRGTTSDAD